ncbi:MAG TPA: ATP-binding cassette domain-containing protein [Candidatus Polarisedimenticolaceae bacterium]|nr:ATP-binding cassette domain-containing protein [Candidatus Polarisedimenticolaceae bacterium]
MIQLRNVKKSYGEFPALRGISTSIERGEIVGLLGPNGAGKTTAMRILTGFLLPSAGTAIVAGHDVVERPLEVQQRIGYLPENAPSYGDMLAQDYLQFMAEMRGLAGAPARERIGRAVEDCGLGHVLTRPIGQLSKGYRQRVGLAAAILHEPEILILDEPTTGLDPNQIVEVRDLIRRMGRTKTVILSTHILSEVEATCDRAVILIDGLIRADGSLDQLTRSRVQVVSLAAGDPAEARRLFAGLPGVTAVDVADDDGDRFHTYRLQLNADGELGETVAEAARQRGWPLRELRRDDKTLEQVFRELTEAPAEVTA